jgi:hypothetical protein
VALETADGQVKMGGRFAYGFEGVWSAACTRQSASVVPSGGQRGGDISGRAGPPLTTRPPAASTPSTGSCTISGTATGPRASVAPAFSVMLFGPNADTTLRTRQAFANGQFHFQNLPDGRYVIATDTKADVMVHVEPPRQTVVCQGRPVSVSIVFR